VSALRDGTIIPINPGNFYVDGSIGNDSYNCLATSIADWKGSCLTIQHAAEVALSYDAHGKNYDVHIAPVRYQDLSISGNIWAGQGSSPMGDLWNWMVQDRHP